MSFRTYSQNHSLFFPSVGLLRQCVIWFRERERKHLSARCLDGPGLLLLLGWRAASLKWDGQIGETSPPSRSPLLMSAALRQEKNSRWKSARTRVKLLFNERVRIQETCAGNHPFKPRRIIIPNQVSTHHYSERMGILNAELTSSST